MNIALDYDDTYTRDPKLWLNFVTAATQAGHTVYVVTLRTPEEAQYIDPFLAGAVEGRIFATSRVAKKSFMTVNHIWIDVWIDDMPLFINQNYDVKAAIEANY